jgi:hypothetical protein
MTENKENKVSKERKGNDDSQGEVCPLCGKVHPRRQDLNIKATREEVESLILLNNRVSVAGEAAQPAVLQPGVSAEQVQVFVQAALNAKAEGMNMQRQWWREIFGKYPELPRDKNVFVDFETCDFYVNVEVK